MIIYNVTVNVDNEIADDWVEWMKNKHIPDVMNTGKFKDYKFFKILSTQSDETGQTFAIQYFCDDIETLNDYQQNDAPALQQEHLQRYGNKAAAFRTLLEEM
jgi:hypothetical protein